MPPTFFAKQADFRKWLTKNHTKKTELLVGFYKVSSGRPSITWPQSVDEALCFGWIDGVRKNIDVESYSIRFTPRKPTSIWSAINIKKMGELDKLGLVKPEGREAFQRRTESKSKIYSHENEIAQLTPSFEKKFKANKAAWQYFTTQAPSYQKVIKHWIMTAKQETTRTSRLQTAINTSAEGRRIT